MKFEICIVNLEQTIHEHWADSTALESLLPAERLTTGSTSGGESPYATLHLRTIRRQLPTNQGPAVEEITFRVNVWDDHYEDDFIEFRAEHDSSVDWNTSTTIKGPLNLENSQSPWDNVWNGQSPGFEGLLHEGIDIDTFDVSDRMEAGDTSADIKLKTWELENLIYIFVSVPSVASGEGGGTSIGVITYRYGGGG